MYIIDTNCFDECFLFYEITERHYFLQKFIVTQRFGETAIMLCSFKQAFWKKTTFYTRYFHNIVTILLIPKVYDKDSSS